jgi:hypothetical protein
MKFGSSHRREMERGHIKTLVPLTGLFVMLLSLSIYSLAATLPKGYFASRVDRTMMAAAFEISDQFSNIATPIESLPAETNILVTRNRTGLDLLIHSLYANLAQSFAAFSDNTLKGSNKVAVEATAVAERGSVILTAATAQVELPLSPIANGWQVASDWWQTLKESVMTAWSEYRRIIVANWRAFLSGESSQPKIVETPVTKSSLTGSTSTDRDNFKKEIESELRLEMMGWLQTQESAGDNSFGNHGLVVIPSTGDPAKDAALKTSLKNSFSDEVELNFDETGQAGVITPIFRRSTGNPYIFLLTPLNSNQ